MALLFQLRKLVMLQPKPRVPYAIPTVTVGSEKLISVPKFCYLSGTVLNDCSVDVDITARIAKAPSAFGCLVDRLWNICDVHHSIKVSVDKVIVLTVLLYNCETWTLYRRHIKHLDAFHMHC